MMIHLIKNYWQGNLSLGKSFWLLFVLLTYLLSIAIDYIIPSIDTVNMCRYLVVLLTMWGIIYLWQIVGCWRSARIQKNQAQDKGRDTDEI